jgi:hypothetical protein
MPHPSIIHLQPGEEIALLTRAHWLVPVKIFVGAVILFAVPFGVYELVRLAAPTLLRHELIFPVLLLLAVTYTLSVWLFSLTDFVDYFLDVWVVTNGRIVNVEQHGLFRRVTSELNLSSIQDVTAETKGLIQTFFKFGDVFVQTAAEHERFHMKKVPRPDQIKMLVMQLSEKDRLHEQGVGKTGAA